MVTAQADVVVPIIDVDSHVTEPPDLWTSRISTQKWGDRVPHVAWDEASQEDRWFLGDFRMSGVGAGACAGWHKFFPNYPPTIGDAERGSWNSSDRLQRLDDFGIQAQLLYPNLLGASSAAFLSLKEPELMLACVRAYNDFISDFSAADPSRLVPLTMLPYWDIQESVAEIKRCWEMGHKGIVTAAKFDAVGFPPLSSGYWDEVLDAAQYYDLSINFHVGFSAFAQADLEAAYGASFELRKFVQDSVMVFLGNASTISEIILSGLCDRYPRLNFVSVESGAGYIPYLLEAMDWQWLNTGCRREFPDTALPSEVFRRQVYGTFWFENASLASIEGLSNNIMFETDYPHPTSLSPGPASYAENPSDMARSHLAEFDPVVVRKLLHDNAARVYHLD
jgi:predicted TIM-barrel fold metal-dependent hydrolase